MSEGVPIRSEAIRLEPAVIRDALTLYSGLWEAICKIQLTIQSPSENSLGFFPIRSEDPNVKGVQIGVGRSLSGQKNWYMQSHDMLGVAVNFTAPQPIYFQREDTVTEVVDRQGDMLDFAGVILTKHGLIADPQMIFDPLADPMAEFGHLVPKGIAPDSIVGENDLLEDPYLLAPATEKLIVASLRGGMIS